MCPTPGANAPGSPTEGIRVMSLPCLLLSLALPLADGPAPPGTIVFLAEQREYRDLESRELTFEGLLQRTPGTGKLGGRFNPYRLSVREGEGVARLYELHLPEKAHLLTGLVGQSVRIIGKVVPVKVEERTVQELWPARLQVLTIRRTDQPGPDGIYARLYWQPGEAQRRGPGSTSFATGSNWRRLCGLSDLLRTRRRRACWPGNWVSRQLIGRDRCLSPFAPASAPILSG